MANGYTRLYAMKNTTAYIGGNKPDMRPAPAVNPPVPPRLGSQDFEDENNFFPEQDDNENTADRGSSNRTVFANETKDGWVAYGITAQRCLYADFDLLTVIRMYPISFVNTQYPGCTSTALNNLRDGLALQAYKIANLTLVAKDPNVVYPLYGKTHTTSMVISALAVPSEMAEYFGTKEIKIGPDLIKYKVLPGSFKLKAIKTPTTEIA